MSMVKLANMPQIRKMLYYYITIKHITYICVHTSYTDYKKFTKCFKNNTVEIALPIYKTVKTLICQIAHLINFDPNSELALPICIYQIYWNVCRCLYSNKHEPLFIISFSNNFTYSSRTLSEKKHFYI